MILPAFSGGDSASTSTSSPRPSRSTTRGSRSWAICLALSYKLLSSTRSLRPNRTATKMEAATATRPRPAARTSSVTVLSRRCADSAASTTPICAPFACTAAWIVWAVAWKAAGYTGIGWLAGLASTWFSMAWSLWYAGKS